MSTQPIAAYSFLPWARQGLGVYIREGNPGEVRGSIDVSLQITGERIGGGQAIEPVPRAVQLYGPGDIIDVEARAIVRTEPRNWITNFETNYLPFVEFYDEDFPWRYTPTQPSPDGKRLRPWLALVVLAEGEFTDGANVPGQPLPFIVVADAAQKFPPSDQLWAWAHVHVNGGLGSYSDTTDALAGKLDAAVKADRDIAYSRMLCPRILKPNTAYHAFLVPSFETGRLAGLKLDPALAKSATRGAWEIYDGRPEPRDAFPYYHRWYFRTGVVGDFEYLVRLLQPRTVDPRVGRRDLDVQAPGPNLGLPGIPELGGVLRLGGALRAPLDTLSDQDLREYNRFEHWGDPYPHIFQTRLAALINLSDDYADQAALDANNASNLPPAAEDEDPWIVPPIYGRWHSETQRLVPADGDPDRRRWVQELNLDPRHRVAAGFGTQVVQKYQESYMEAAWQQVGKVLEGNARIRYGQMAKFATLVWHSRELAALQKRSPERYLAIAAPVQRRVLADGLTIHHRVQRSTLPLALTSKTARQALRPRGRVARRIGFDADRSPANLLERVNQGKVSAAPPKAIAPNLPSGEKLSDDLRPRDLPREWLDALERHPWLRFLPLALALLISVLLAVIRSSLAIPAGAALAVGAIWLYDRIARTIRRGGTGTRTPAMEKMAGDLGPRDLPRAWQQLIARYPWLRFTPLILALAVEALLSVSESSFATLAGAILVAAAVWLMRWIEAILRQARAADALHPERRTPASVDRLPSSPDFGIGVPGQGHAPTPGERDSAEAVRFKAALRNLYTVDVVERGIPLVVRQPLALEAIAQASLAGLHPIRTVEPRVLASIFIPDRIRDRLLEPFGEVMVYPEIDLPMYAPLKDISSELFLPNIQLIENNSITLLETNQKFIEAYLVGLNHEMARELLWREYPTDQRGSYFRQFWEVRGFLAQPGVDREALRERLFDIPELHTWTVNTGLGDHDHREAQGDKEDELVLVIRGELLKKYPTAVIYAHRADWELLNGEPDKSRPRKLLELTPEQEDDPPRDIVKTPLYEAKVDPDIYFFGFDLTADKARGGQIVNGKEAPGWFFVIKERPGEPRFGLDLPKPASQATVNTWNDLAWTDVLTDYNTSAFLRVGEREVTLTNPNASGGLQDQYNEDSRFRWRADTHAAELAYILYQVPVLMAVHAAEMLKKTG